MRKCTLLFISILLLQLAYAQDSTVNLLFRDIAAMGHEYESLKGEKDAAKILEISKRVAAIDNRIRQTEITGVDSILFNIHQFSTYLNFYADFLNNPITLPDSLRPAQVFRQLGATAKFLQSFDTLGYDTEYVEELYFPKDETVPAPGLGTFINSGTDTKSLTGIAPESEVKVLALSKMAGLRCCKIRVKVRVRVVMDSPKKTYDKVVNVIENAVNTVGRLVPAEVKELGVKIFAAALEVEGNYIHFLNDLNQRVFSVTFETFEFLRTLQEKTDKQLLNATSHMMNTVGLDMPDEIEATLDKMITARSNVLRETMNGFSKAMELNYKVNDMTGDALKLFSKYLLLAGTDYPQMFNRPKPAISAADAYVQVNVGVMQKAVDKLFAHTIDLDTAKYKGFKMLLNGSEHKLAFDKKTGSILVELGDFNVKGMYLLGGMADLIAPSATVNIKKAKIQLVPELSKEDHNTINLRPRLYYLDVKGAMPLFDRLIAWAIEKNFLENKVMPLELDSILYDQFELRASQPASLPIAFGNLKDFSIVDNKLMLALNKSLQQEGHLNGVTLPEEGFSMIVSEHLVGTILSEAIGKEGIRFSLKKDTSSAPVFDPSYNYLHFKKLNAFKMEEEKMLLDVNTQVHMRRFLGKKPKLNFEVTHAAFYITPVLGKNKKGEPVLNLMMLPAIDQFEIDNLNKRLTRKTLKLFKQAKEPTRLAEVKLESLQSIKFENPFRKGENLLDRFENLVFKMEQGRLVVNVK